MSEYQTKYLKCFNFSDVVGEMNLLYASVAELHNSILHVGLFEMRTEGIFTKMFNTMFE